MLPIILSAVAVVIVLLVFVIINRPADFRVSRTALVSAPPAVVFEQVNDLHNWEKWSPWAKLDPTMQQTYEGSPFGVGAKYSWNGNNKVGAGCMEIVESLAPERIRIQLDFLRPFAATNDTVFSFQADNGNTIVTWTMTGRNDAFLAKAFALVMNMDRMVGREFEKGLADMKALAESAATPSGAIA